MEMAKSFFGRDHEGYVGKKDHAVSDRKIVITICARTRLEIIDFY